MVAENFMLTGVEMITPSTTYHEVDEMLDSSPFKSFPLVDSKGRLTLRFAESTKLNAPRSSSLSQTAVGPICIACRT